MNRALTGYDVSQSTLAAAEKAVTDKKTQVVLRRAMNLLGTPIAGRRSSWRFWLQWLESTMCSVLRLGSSYRASPVIWRVTLAVS